MMIKNKLQQQFILNLIRGRNVYLPAGGTLSISKDELESPQVQALMQRGAIALLPEESRMEATSAMPSAKPAAKVEPVTAPEYVTTISPVTTNALVRAAVKTPEPDLGSSPRNANYKTGSAKTKQGNKNINSKGDLNA